MFFFHGGRCNGSNKLKTLCFRIERCYRRRVVYYVTKKIVFPNKYSGCVTEISIQKWLLELCYGLFLYL